MCRLRWLPVMISIVLLISACSGLGAEKPSDLEMSATVAVMQQTIDVARIQAEQTAQAWMTEQSAVQEDIEGGAGTAIPYGAISGTLSYPSESIPPLRVVAFNIINGAFVALEVEAGTSVYHMDNVPPGEYQLVAYLIDGTTEPGFGGGYTEAVLCGLQASCTNHSLIAFEVHAGEETMGIDPVDWYAGIDGFMPDPTR